MTDRFTECLPFILKEEGGYSNLAADRGGATNKGIIQSEYDHYRAIHNELKQSVKNLSDQEVQDIYRNEYWNAAHCGELPKPIDLVTFDGAVNHGTKRAIIFLQRAVNTTDDGVFGPATAAALQHDLQVNSCYEIAYRIIKEREQFYRDIVAHDSSQTVFLNGWLNRMKDLDRELV